MRLVVYKSVSTGITVFKELFHKLKCYVVNIYGGGSQIASIVTFIPKIRNKNYLKYTQKGGGRGVKSTMLTT